MSITPRGQSLHHQEVSLHWYDFIKSINHPMMGRKLKENFISRSFFQLLHERFHPNPYPWRHIFSLQRSPLLSSTRHVCKKALILKMISDGEPGNFPSMARLLRAMSITLRGQSLHRQEPYMIWLNLSTIWWDESEIVLNVTPSCD